MTSEGFATFRKKFCFPGADFLRPKAPKSSLMDWHQRGPPARFSSRTQGPEVRHQAQLADGQDLVVARCTWASPGGRSRSRDSLAGSVRQGGLTALLLGCPGR